MLSKSSSSIFTALLFIVAGQSAAQNASVFTQWQSSPATSRLIDYSYAGFHGGKCLPPRISGPMYNVVDYGAVPDDNKDDIDAIQKAVDAACRNGGGVVLFCAGTFDFDLNNPKQNPNVRIWASNVVIRGAGSGSNGTVLYDHKANIFNPGVPGDGWITVKLPNFFSLSSVDMHNEQELWYPNSQYDPITKPVTTINPAPRLSNIVTVADASKLVVGGTYTVTQADPDMSLVWAMAPGSPAYGERPSAVGTDYKAMKYRQIVRITAISGNQVTLDNPLLLELKSAWSPTLWPTEHPVVREIGLEDIRMKMDAVQPFVHHDGAGVDYGNHFVRFDWVEDGWASNVISDGASSAFYLRDSKNCIIYDCAVVGAEGHFGYELCGTGSRNLFLRCNGNRQFHTFSIEGGVGNVFKDCIAGDTAAVDLHGNVFGIYNLFDNIRGCTGAGGGDVKQVPPNHGIGFTAWNWQMGTCSPYTKVLQDVFVDVTAYVAYNAPGFIAAGVRSKDGHTVYYTDLAKAKQTANLSQNWGYAESINAAVLPISLYDAQRSQTLNYNWCELTAPGYNTVFAHGSSVNVVAEAGAASGKSVSKVEFFINGSSIGSDNSAPFTATWNASSLGAYTLTATMSSSDGPVVTSKSRRIIVGTVQIIEDNNTALAYTGRVEIQTQATSSGGTDRWVAQGDITYSFKGTYISIYTNLISQDGQRWNIFLDGTRVVDSLGLPRVSIPNYLVWDSGQLTDATHTVVISSKPAAGLDLDYMIVTSTGTPDPSVIYSLDNPEILQQNRAFAPKTASLIVAYSLQGRKTGSFPAAGVHDFRGVAAKNTARGICILRSREGKNAKVDLVW